MKRFSVVVLIAACVLSVRANEFSATNAPASLYQSIQQVRARCLQDSRMICGKIIRILPDGLVVESGYTDLLRPPLMNSWLVPGVVSATRTPNLVETRDPGSPAVGTVFLTDLPRLRGKSRTSTTTSFCWLTPPGNLFIPLSALCEK